MKQRTLKKNNEQLINQRLLDKISTNTSQGIERLSDIVWTMKSKYDKGDRLMEKLEITSCI